VTESAKIPVVFGVAESRIYPDRTDNHHSDTRIYRPDKKGNLKLIKTVKTDYLSSLSNVIPEMHTEKFKCVDCGQEELRIIRTNPRKHRCIACQRDFRRAEDRRRNGTEKAKTRRKQLKERGYKDS